MQMDTRQLVLLQRFWRSALLQARGPYVHSEQDARTDSCTRTETKETAHRSSRFLSQIDKICDVIGSGGSYPRYPGGHLAQPLIQEDGTAFFYRR